MLGGEFCGFGYSAIFSLHAMYSYIWDKPLDWLRSDAPQGAATRYGDVCVTVVFCTLVFIVVTGGPTAGDPPTVNHKRNVVKIVHLICQWQSTQVWNLKLHYFHVSYFRATHVVLLFRYNFPQTRFLFRYLQAVAYRGGVWGVQTPTRNSEGPTKLCQTQPDLWKLNLGRQHPKMFRKKAVKF